MDAEGFGELFDRLKCHVSFRPLDAAHVRPMKVGPVRKFILRPAFCRPEFANAFSENFVESCRRL